MSRHVVGKRRNFSSLDSEPLRLLSLLGILSSLLSAAPLWAIENCRGEEISSLEKLLKDAQLSIRTDPDSPTSEQDWQCDKLQAEQVRAVMRVCGTTMIKPSLYLAGGRCLQRAGLAADAVKSYSLYLRGRDPFALPERLVRERHTALKWLADLGITNTATAALVVDTNLQGALLQGLPNFPEGLILQRGQNFIRHAEGSYSLKLILDGFKDIRLDVDLVDGGSARVVIDWYQHLAGSFLGDWRKFEKSHLTFRSYQNRALFRYLINGFTLAIPLAVGGGIIAGCAGDTLCATDSDRKLYYPTGAAVAVAGFAISIPMFITLSKKHQMPESNVPRNEETMNAQGTE